jgi:hypothetical protein
MSNSIGWQTQLRQGDRITVLVRPQAINLLVNDEQPSYTFDLKGRLFGAFQASINYRRGLDNRVLAKWSEGHGPKRRRRHRWLDTAEAQALIETAYGWVQALHSQIELAPPDVRAAIRQMNRWDWQSLEGDRRLFEEIYSPVAILPPDQYLALVLQATQGCSHNTCTFCTFYRDIPFQIKTPDQFRRHIRAVLDFFGPALTMRRSIFLADANALVTPMPRLLDLMDVLEDFPELLGGQSQTIPGELQRARSSPSLPIFAFIDAFHGQRKFVSDWQELRARGLRRVYIGMESGHDPLLCWLNKPGQAVDVLETVREMKEAGLQASVIIMIGVGGDRFAEGHVRDTVQLLNAMPLAAGDLIYLSDFVGTADAPYVRLAAQMDMGALSTKSMRAQERAIRAGFVAQNPNSPPQFARYNIETFIY